MGCVCSRQAIKASSTSTLPNSPESQQSILKANLDNSNSMQLKYKLSDEFTLIVCGTSEVVTNMKTSRLLKTNQIILTNILNFISSTSKMKQIIQLVRSRPYAFKDYKFQIRDFYEIATSSSLFHKLIKSLMIIQIKASPIANSNTVAVCNNSSAKKIDSFSGRLGKFMSLSPMTKISTFKNQHNLAILTNFNNIKDIADEIQVEQLFIGKISKFKSFG